MKTGLKIIVIAAILLLSTRVHALSVMGFETPPFPFGSNFNEFMHGTYTENGLRMQNTVGHYDLFNGGSLGGRYVNLDTGSFSSNFLNGPVSTVRFDRPGGLFDLLSIDVIGDLFHGDGSLTSSAGGLLVFSAISGIQTFSGAPWTNLTWVDFTSVGGFVGIDNFTAQAIPEPSSLWLVLAGLGILVTRSVLLLTEPGRQ